MKNKDKKENLKETEVLTPEEEAKRFEEEDVVSPFKTIVNTYRSNVLAMVALITFLSIALFVIIGPIFHPVDLSYQESTQQNIAPGRDMMKFPKELDGNLKDIAVGPTFSFGVDNNGKVYSWGKTKITSIIDLKEMIPEDLPPIASISAGRDHVLAIDEDGRLYSWGNNRQQQTAIPAGLDKLGNIKEIEAGFQNSIIVEDNGMTHYFGNATNNDFNIFHEMISQVEKIETTGDTVIGLFKDGSVGHMGSLANNFANWPEGNNFKNIAATGNTAAAVDEDNNVYVWGNLTSVKKDEGKTNEADIPEIEGNIIDIQGGRYHYVVLTDDGKVYTWGVNNFGVLNVPKSIENEKIERIYVGYYQNYAVDSNGKIHTWGHKGYPLGSDEFGRDIFQRLLNGGRMSMTIGAVAVIISTIIGIIIGGVSGYFGGKVDMILQRISEMVSSLPFLPFAMILTSLIGNRLTMNQRVYLIMVVLGFLSWVGLQRLVRAQVFAIREQEFVIAARSVGVREKDIVFKHILPNVISIILVSMTLSFASSMLTESTLSFLGFGVQAPQPTWGNMLNGASDSRVIQQYWWRWVFASVALGVCVICINLIGDGLRDAIDPKSRER